VTERVACDEGKAQVKVSLYRPEASRRLRLHESWHIKVVRLSAICTSGLYPQEIFLVFIHVRG
jgi:hypothetical protein